MKTLLSPKTIDPFFVAAFILYGLALVGLAMSTNSWWTAPLLGLGVMVLSGVVFVVTRWPERQPAAITCPKSQLWSLLVWFGLVLLLAAVTLAQGIELVNGFTNWFFLLLVPLGLLAVVRRPDASLRAALRSVGLTRAGTKNALKVAALTILLSIPLLYVVGEQQRAGIQMFFDTPLAAATRFLISFVLAFITAGFVEEFFFRGLLQTRLAACLGSEWRGLLVAALLFGLLHAPLFYYSSFEPTQGNLLWAVASAIAEPAVLGVLLGVIWLRTRNLAAPVLVHTFVNSLALMATLQVSIGG